MDVDLGGMLLHNTTYNYDDDYIYVDDSGLSSSTAVLIPLVYTVLLVLGLLVNGFLLIILGLKRQSWRMSDTFILHLGLADILLLVTLPLWASQSALQCGWCFRGVSCRISGAVFNISFYCGTFLLVCLILDRYLSAVHDIQLFSHKRPALAHISCLIIWFLSLLLSIPDWASVVSDRDPDQDQEHCSPNFELLTWQLVSRMFHLVLGFLLPVATMIIFFSCILLRMQDGIKGLQKQRAVIVILALAVAFFLSWLPYNITLLVDTLTSQSETTQVQKSSSGNPGHSIKTALMVTSVLCCLHACLRPLTYLGLCQNFRKQTLSVLRCNKVEFKGSLWELGVGDDMQTDQSQDPEELKQMTNDEHQVQSSQC